MNGHWNDDELIDLLYGLKRDTEAHLETCADCSRRWREMQRVRQTILARPAAGIEKNENDFLAAQRRAIYTRLGEAQRPASTAWIPALGAAALLALALAMYHPAVPVSHPVHTAVAAAPDASDTKLFSDVYSMVQSDEPTVAAPLHTLFDGNQD